MPSTREDVSTFIKSAFYGPWREKVQATGGCLHPIRLSGSYQVTDSASGRVLHDHSGQIMAPCGTRRASLCPACADRYAGDAYHLVRAGLTGDDTKNVPADVASAPMVFATLTAPSFGRVHTRRQSKRGFVIPCGCGEKHAAADTRIGVAIDPDSYDYEGAVLWQAHSGVLWQRYAMAVRRHLAAAGGIPTRDLRDHAIVAYSKVAEYQKRGLVHFHAVIRVDGPDGPASAAPSWVTPALLERVVRSAAASVTVESWRPTGEVLALKWGAQVDVQPIAAASDDQASAGMSASAIAGYIAKYATKDSGATDSGIDRRIRSRDHITQLADISDHHRQMMLTAWDLGDHASYEDLKLRRWAHMLAFRGHFLTKSQAYSTTFTRLRQARALHRFAALLDQLDVSEEDITVINDWSFTGVGHNSPVERELAEAIGEGLRARRQTQSTL